MHRSVTLPIVLCLITATSVLGQVAEPLSGAQRLRFEQNRFSIELPGLQVVGASGEELQVGYSKGWLPFKGYTRMSESAFFEQVGQYTLAEQAKRSRRTKLITLGLGILSILTGAFLMASGADFKGAGQPGLSMGRVLGGGLLFTAGGGAMGLSAMRLRRREAPYWIAEEVAREYNSALMEQIEGGH